MKPVRFGYMCKIDFDHELGVAKGGTNVYASVKDLKENHKCADECGIVKVTVVLEEVTQPEDFDKMLENGRKRKETEENPLNDVLNDLARKITDIRDGKSDYKLQTTREHGFGITYIKFVHKDENDE